MLEGCIALFAGGIVAIATESPATFLIGTTGIAGVGFGPAYLGGFRTVVTLAANSSLGGVKAIGFVSICSTVAVG